MVGTTGTTGPTGGSTGPICFSVYFSVLLLTREIVPVYREVVSVERESARISAPLDTFYGPLFISFFHLLPHNSSNPILSPPLLT
jgi:hypothetical protein